MLVNPVNINSVNQNFGSSLTVNKIIIMGDDIAKNYSNIGQKIILNSGEEAVEIYSKRGPRLVKNSETDVLVKAIIKALVKNLKLDVDTPIARQIMEFVPDLYYKGSKRVKECRLPDTGKEVNLLTGKEAIIEDEINKTSLKPLEKKYRRREAIQEMFKAGSDKHKGCINIYVTERDIEKEGKEMFELFAIDHIEHISH